MTSPAPVTNIIDGKAVTGSSETSARSSTRPPARSSPNSPNRPRATATPPSRPPAQHFPRGRPAPRAHAHNCCTNWSISSKTTLTSSLSWNPSTPASRSPSPAATNCPAWPPRCATSPAPGGPFPARPQGSSSRATPAMSGVSRSAWSSASLHGTSLCGKRFGSSGRRWPREHRRHQARRTDAAGHHPVRRTRPARSCRPECSTWSTAPVG